MLQICKSKQRSKLALCGFWAGDACKTLTGQIVFAKLCTQLCFRHLGKVVNWWYSKQTYLTLKMANGQTNHLGGSSVEYYRCSYLYHCVFYRVVNVTFATFHFC